MPCRSYESDDELELSKVKEIANKLARIACKALTELERLEQEDFLLLKDEEVREWWIQHKIDDAAAEAERLKAIARRKARADALAKLTPTERKLLGL